MLVIWKRTACLYLFPKLIVFFTACKFNFFLGYFKNSQVELVDQHVVAQKSNQERPFEKVKLP